MSRYIFPEQRVSWSEKQKEKWYQLCTDYIIDVATSQPRDNIASYYNGVAGYIDPRDYSYVTNPFTSNNPKLTAFPTRLRNYDIITPILERYVGEYITQYSEYLVKIHDSELIIRRDEEVNNMISKTITQIFINSLKEYQAQIQQDQDQGNNSNIPMPDFNEMKKKFIESYIDKREKQGQEILDYVIDITDSELKYIEGFFDYWIAGEVYSYRDIRNKSIYKEIVSPLEMFPVSNGEYFVEDFEMVCRKKLVTIPYILDNYTDILEDKDIKYIKDLMKNTPLDEPILVPLGIVKSRHDGEFYTSFYDKYFSDTKYMFCGTDRNIYEYHCVWSTETKVGILKYQNELGEILEKEVEDGYQINPQFGDISINWIWRNHIIETRRFGDEHSGVYVKPREIICQRTELSNTNPKLPYNGKIGMFARVGNASIAKRLIPYQLLTNIFRWVFEKTINADKGKIILMPESVMNDSEEFTQEDRMYYIAADKILYINDEDLNSAAYQAMKVLDASLHEYIQQMMLLIKDIKAEAWEVANMNAQRFGEIKPDSGKGVTQEAIYRISMASVPFFEMYNKFKEKDYNADLDYSKIAFIDGIVSSYRDQSGNVNLLDIDPIEHAGTEYGVFAKNSARENNKLKQAQELAFSMAQNGQSDIAMEVLDAHSFSKIKELVTRATDIQRKYDMEKEASLKSMDLQIEQEKFKNDEANRQNEKEIAIIKETGATEREYIKKDVNILTSLNLNPQSDDYKATEVSLKERELQFKEQQSIRDSIIKEKTLKSNEKIAKMNKNKYDAKNRK